MFGAPKFPQYSEQAQQQLAEFAKKQRRDKIALRAMSSLIMAEQDNPDVTAEMAYAFADAMMAKSNE